MNGVKTSKGGYMCLEDYCNSTKAGSGLYYTSSMVTADEELLGVELGQRVVVAVLEKAIDGWDALMDLSYKQWAAAEEQEEWDWGAWPS